MHHPVPGKLNMHKLIEHLQLESSSQRIAPAILLLLLLLPACIMRAKRTERIIQRRTYLQWETGVVLIFIAARSLPPWKMSRIKSSTSEKVCTPTITKSTSAGQCRLSTLLVHLRQPHQPPSPKSSSKCWPNSGWPTCLPAQPVLSAPSQTGRCHLPWWSSCLLLALQVSVADALT